MKNTKQLKIAIFDMDNLKNPFWAAGQARLTREIGKRLAKNYQVTVYCSKYPGYQDYQADGISYKHIGISSSSAILTNIAFIIAVSLKARSVKEDIILEYFNAPISVTFAPLFAKVPLIGVPTMFNAQQFAKKYHLPFHWIESVGMKFYKYLLPFSDVDSSKAKRLNPNIDFKIISHGVDKSFFRIKHRTPQHILFLSRFDIQQKGLDLLLKSYAKVAKKIKYPLVIAGHGPDEAKVQQLIRNLKLTNQVQIVGPAYGEKKVKLIEEALFVVFPSRHDEISLWTLEALASGMPIVAFDLPESKWMDARVALKSKPFDLKLYAQSLLKAADKRLNNQMRKNAREFAKRFSWEKVVADYEEYILYTLKKEQRI